MFERIAASFVYNMVQVHRGVKAAEAAPKNVTFAFLFSGHGSVLIFAKEAQTSVTGMPKGGRGRSQDPAFSVACYN